MNVRIDESGRLLLAESVCGGQAMRQVDGLWIHEGRWTGPDGTHIVDAIREERANVFWPNAADLTPG